MMCQSIKNGDNKIKTSCVESKRELLEDSGMEFLVKEGEENKLDNKTKERCLGKNQNQKNVLQKRFKKKIMQRNSANEQTQKYLRQKEIQFA